MKSRIYRTQWISCFIFFAVIAADAQKPNLIIRAEIKGLDAGQWVYWSTAGSNSKDSVKTSANGFLIQANIAPGEGSAYIIRIGPKYAEDSFLFIYLDEGKLSIKGNGPGFRDAALSGTPYIREYNSYKTEVDKNALLKDAIDLYKKANDLYAKHDSVGLAKIQPELDKLDSIRTVLSKQWITKNHNSPISAFVLNYELRQKMSFPELDSALNTLSASAKNNTLAKDLARAIEIDRLTGIGKPALDFTQNDTLGNPVSLHSFKGKYLLIDFWASWCKPCRAENPNLVKAYQAFRNKNFTILSVSLDQPGQKEKWLNAIHQDSLSWTHVSDLQFWNNAVAKQYGIESIPSNLLLDTDGKIIAKDLREGELEKKLSEILK